MKVYAEPNQQAVLIYIYANWFSYRSYTVLLGAWVFVTVSKLSAPMVNSFYKYSLSTLYPFNQWLFFGSLSFFYSSHKNFQRLLDKCLLFITHYVQKLLLLQFEAGNICRSFSSCWCFLLLALADVQVPSAQLAPPQIHILTASKWFPRDDTGSKPARCSHYHLHGFCSKRLSAPYPPKLSEQCGI